MDTKKLEAVIEACDELLEEMKEMPILLSDEEIQEVQRACGWYCNDNEFFGFKKPLEAIAQAQLKKVVEWLKDNGIETEVDTLPLDKGDFILPLDKWQSLKEEAGLT